MPFIQTRTINACSDLSDLHPSSRISTTNENGIIKLVVPKGFISRQLDSLYAVFFAPKLSKTEHDATINAAAELIKNEYGVAPNMDFVANYLHLTNSAPIRLSLAELKDAILHFDEKALSSSAWQPDQKVLTTSLLASRLSSKFKADTTPEEDLDLLVDLYDESKPFLSNHGRPLSKEDRELVAAHLLKEKYGLSENSTSRVDTDKGQAYDCVRNIVKQKFITTTPLQTQEIARAKRNSKEMIADLKNPNKATYQLYGTAKDREYWSKIATNRLNLMMAIEKQRNSLLVSQLSIQFDIANTTPKEDLDLLASLDSNSKIQLTSSDRSPLSKEDKKTFADHLLKEKYGVDEKSSISSINETYTCATLCVTDIANKELPITIWNEIITDSKQYAENDIKTAEKKLTQADGESAKKEATCEVEVATKRFDLMTAIEMYKLPQSPVISK